MLHNFAFPGMPISLFTASPALHFSYSSSQYQPFPFPLSFVSIFILACVLLYPVTLLTLHFHSSHSHPIPSTLNLNHVPSMVTLYSERLFPPPGGLGRSCTRGYPSQYFSKS